MKKVLIISYFFPPCNLTAGQRIKGWTNYLHESGYYPIVITRNWDIPIKSPEDVLKSSGTEIVLEKHEHHETYYLPYESSRRDRIYTKYQGSPLQKISRAFTLFNLIAENYTPKVIPHQNMYQFARNYLKEHKDVDCLIVSGNPFNQFYFGYLLNKEFGIKWIADYRDDWNTSELAFSRKGMNSLVGKLQQKSEKKWVGSAEMICSVSQVYADKIAAFVNRPGHTILNGYDLPSDTKPTEQTGKYILTYNGSLYPTQSIEPFLSAVGRLISEGYEEIQLNFPGLAYDPSQETRVRNATTAFEQHVHITNRIPREDVIALQRKSDVLVMISHTGIKGIPSSKLYEYIGLQKEVLLYPNDHSIIEQTLNEVELGLICDTEQQIFDVLKARIEAKRNNGTTPTRGNEARIKSYSRQHQAKKLAALLDKLNSGSKRSD